MITAQHIPRLRLAAQQLAGTSVRSPAALVSHFGAMQAQDYSMCKWAVGARLHVTEREVEAAINSGAIVRTHVLRPTWHLVAAADARWMLELTAPHIRRAYMSMCRKLGMDEKMLKKWNITIARLLSGNNYLTREEIMRHITLPGVMDNDFRPSLVMMNAEMDALVCNGPMRSSQFTYALLDERVPPTARPARNEALAMLAQRYFDSHGPATAADFAWWSGLPAADVKLAVEMVKKNFETIADGTHTYLLSEKVAASPLDMESTHFLPAFDEFLISYRNREASIPLQQQALAFTRNGIFKPIMVVNGEVVGTWKRSFKNESAIVEPTFFAGTAKSKQRNILKHLASYAFFTGRKIVIAPPA